MYDTDEEAAQKIGNTIILYKGEPVWVERIRSRNAICIPVPLKQNMDGDYERLTVPLTDPQLTYRNMRLGYINQTTGAMYVLRQATRRSQQGLNGNNLRTSGGVGGRRGDVNFDNLLRSQGMKDTLTNTYPTYAAALDKVEDMFTTGPKKDPNTGAPMSPVWAFSRSLAIEKGRLQQYFIRHKGIQICATIGKPKQFHLTEEYEHLKETLEEYRVPLA